MSLGHHPMSPEAVQRCRSGAIGRSQQGFGGHDHGKLRDEISPALDTAIDANAAAARVLRLADRSVEKFRDSNSVEHFAHALPHHYVAHPTLIEAPFRRTGNIFVSPFHYGCKVQRNTPHANQHRVPKVASSCVPILQGADMTKRNFGLSFEKLPADPYRPTGEPETVRSFISGDLKETVAAGFLVTFAVLVGALFGVFTFFASLLIEPSGTTQLVQYEQHLGLNR